MFLRHIATSQCQPMSFSAYDCRSAHECCSCHAVGCHLSPCSVCICLEGRLPKADQRFHSLKKLIHRSWRPSCEPQTAEYELISPWGVFLSSLFKCTLCAPLQLVTRYSSEEASLDTIQRSLIAWVRLHDCMLFDNFTFGKASIGALCGF